MPYASRTFNTRHLIFDKIKVAVSRLLPARQSFSDGGLVVNCRLKHGFTLIELLVVISIIGILIGAATVSWSNAQQKSRDSKRKIDLKTIQQTLELYFEENGYYPPFNWDGWCAILSHPQWTQLQTELVPTYINKLPMDPIHAGVSDKDYLYKRVSASQYELVANLENPNDPDLGSYFYCSAANMEYNYQVTPP